MEGCGLPVSSLPLCFSRPLLSTSFSPLRAAVVRDEAAMRRGPPLRRCHRLGRKEGLPWPRHHPLPPELSLLLHLPPPLPPRLVPRRVALLP